MKIFDKTMWNAFFITDLSLILILTLVFIGDVLTFVFFRENLNFSFVFKGIIMSFLIINLIISNTKLWLGIIALFLSVAIGIIFNYLNDFPSKISLFVEYLSGLMIFNFLMMSNRKKIVSIFCSYIFMFYCITIIVAFLFQIEGLKTYHGMRFGYMPFFNSQNEFSFIMIAIVVFFYQKYITAPLRFNLLLFLIAIISSLMIGTKVLYIFTIFFVSYLIFKRISFQRFFLAVVSILCCILLFREYIISFAKHHFRILTDAYSNYGFINAISSLRYAYFEERIHCQFASMSWYNYVFGGMRIDCITEMSIFDILLMFGIFGSIFYFILLKKHILNKLNLDEIGYFFIISVTVLSFLSGYFFENFSAQFYVICVLYVYYCSDSAFSQHTKA